MTMSVYAKTIKMASITSEFDNNKREYFLELDDQNHIHSLRYITTMPNGAIIEDGNMTPEEVVEDGVVVFEHKGYKAVILEAENFNVKTGGIVKINYLVSGITGARQQKNFQLKMVNNSFALFDQGKPVNKLFFELNRARVVGVIGVKNIQASFVNGLTE